MKKFIIATLSALALIGAGAGSAASVTPTTVEGNFTISGDGASKTCSDYVEGAVTVVGTTDPSTDGVSTLSGFTVSNSSFTITVTQTDGNSIDFSIAGGTVLAAVVKGSSSFNLYDYQPAGVTADTALVPPNFPGFISHYVFCVGNPTVTAVLFRSGSATRTGRNVLVRWRVASSYKPLGYRVFRLVNGHRVGVGGLLHRTSLVDRTTRNYRYIIKAINTDGSPTWFGPISVS